jgi:hypothetical protein
MPQRIFIENKQRFNMVEISPSTNAGEVVQMIETQAALEKLGAGSGGWMLWEVAQDFGMGKCSFPPDFSNSCSSLCLIVQNGPLENMSFYQTWRGLGTKINWLTFLLSRRRRWPSF